MIHDRVDIERWTALFPLERLRAEVRAKVLAERSLDQERWARKPLEQHVAGRTPKDEIVVSPYDMAAVEQLRAEMLAMIDVGTAVPTDVFVWAKGEPPRREVTKVGGLPYWPKGRAWPECPEGGPMMFVGQFCFADSSDIAGSLPADVLSIFANPTWERLFDTDGADHGMEFVWLTLGITDLVSADEVPAVESNWPTSPYYGAIHRTFDYPDLGADGGDFGWDHPEWSGPGLVKATKIGGVPWWEQFDPGLPGRFLCAQESIQPAFDVPFTYLNVPEPIGPSFEERYPEDNLMWGDLGRLYLHFDGERIHWTVQGG